MMKAVEIDEHGEFRCSCGNYPNAQGAYPCDSEGNELIEGDNFGDLWRCDRCGTIFRAPLEHRGPCEIIA